MKAGVGRSVHSTFGDFTACSSPGFRFMRTFCAWNTHVSRHFPEISLQGFRIGSMYSDDFFTAFELIGAVTVRTTWIFAHKVYALWAWGSVPHLATCHSRPRSVIHAFSISGRSSSSSLRILITSLCPCANSNILSDHVCSHDVQYSACLSDRKIYTLLCSCRSVVIFEPYFYLIYI